MAKGIAWAVDKVCTLIDLILEKLPEKSHAGFLRGVLDQLEWRHSDAMSYDDVEDDDEDGDD